MGVAAGDFDNDGFTDLLITAVGQNRLFHNTGKGTFVGRHRRRRVSADAPGFSTSALWFDYDRDGWLDLLICNYVQVDAGDGRLLQRGRQAEGLLHAGGVSRHHVWLFRNRGDGTFEDVTAKARLFDATSKSLGVTLLDYDLDGWPDLFIANDTQPNKLYRNNGNGTFTELGLQAGLALQRGRPRARRHGRRRRRRRQQRQDRRSS